MKNLFQFMYYFKSKMVPLLQLRHVSTIFLYYFKKNCLLKQIERKKEKERKKKKERKKERRHTDGTRQEKKGRGQRGAG